MPPAERANRKRQDEQLPVPLRALIRSYQDILQQTVDVGPVDTDTIFYISEDDQVFWSVNKSLRGPRPFPRLAAWKTLLKRIPDDYLFPEIPDPETTHLIIAAPGSYSPALTHVKRPRLENFFILEGNVIDGNEFRARQLLAEAKVMEKIACSKAHLHPNIIRYHGCRVHRNRITGLVFERLEYNLDQYVSQPGFSTLDKESYVHSLGLAHNDISPYNIMVRETAGAQPEPVLIDFGSCAPFGSTDLLTFRTPGWCEEDFDTSEKEHDAYSLRKIEK